MESNPPSLFLHSCSTTTYPKEIEIGARQVVTFYSSVSRAVNNWTRFQLSIRKDFSDLDKANDYMWDRELPMSNRKLWFCSYVSGPGRGYEAVSFCATSIILSKN
ncbi:hypothetical protein Fcan01_17389 [Folsomia candida]|uniref:Uncharacterized protein n=1 Tax=Folsomia candida TaxID=158441 RepID=A0A226DU91_FOLCA|nr:hypothetical protein Fcan01_17389 [Folsomia candida]